jgi:pyruvate/2-oxoglutarate dehydrogenase complex dihydrolipoamide dehydrogenase (E3) component
MNVARYDYDIGIVGGGAGGLTVAAGSAQLGAKTLLIEKERELGGDCLHHGCVPSKTLIWTAHVRHLMRNAQAFGLPAVELPPVDFRAVKDRIRSVISAIQRHDSVERFCGLGARVKRGEPRFEDDHVVALDGARVSARHWIIATGSSPSIPSIEGLDRTPFLTNREIFSLDRLPGSMVVLGAGPVAVEMAQAFSRLGTKTHVVQRSGQILSREDKDMADAVMRVLQAEGVAFHLNSSVAGVRDLGGEREIVLWKEGGELVTLRAEAILVAMGRTANVEGLDLENAGVEFDRKGVAVDDRMRTTRRHVYAVGDVTGTYQFTHAAGYEGSIAVSNAVFHLPRKADYRFMPWCTYTHPELAGIGMNEREARAAGIDYSVWTETFEENDRSLAEGEGVGKVKMILDGRGRPLGAQILGPHAGELLGEWVAVLNGRVRLATLAAAVHPYPTLGEINKRVAGTFFSRKIYSETVKKGLKFLFNLKGRACELPEARIQGPGDGQGPGAKGPVGV